MSQAVQTNPSITHIWERFDLRWNVISTFAGIFAGVAILVVASLFLKEQGNPTNHFSKLLGVTFFGTESTTYGGLGVAGFVGITYHLGLSALFGLCFGQLVFEKSKAISIMSLALTTSMIIWVFGWSLFMPSFNYSLFQTFTIPQGVFGHLIFGFAFGLFLIILRSIFYRQKNKS